MTTRHTLELDFTSFIIAAAIIGTVLAMTSNHNSKSPSSFVIPVIQNTNSLPSIAPNNKTISVQLSPDGTKKVTMTTIVNSTKTKSYTITTSTDSGEDETTVYTTNLPQSESLNIPFNTWSPDNQYIFIEHITSDNTEALVMRADGKPLSGSENTFNVTNLFDLRNTGNSYQQTTGWAADNLLIINTTKNGAKSASYWFEVPSKAIIPLSTQF
ncbi:MAG TPA: hypothetical protein VF189_02620 [Patescibacteria group bacterium]